MLLSSQARRVFPRGLATHRQTDALRTYHTASRDLIWWSRHQLEPSPAPWDGDVQRVEGGQNEGARRHKARNK
jgi:hypothetical protein